MARALLAAAQRIIEQRGFAALTLEAVARESGENKAMVAYYFGNKAGLVAAILDSIIHNECTTIAARVEEVPDRERLHVMLAGICELTTSRERFHAYFDILPHALRDEVLRRRLIDLYEWYIAFELEWLGLDATAGDEEQRRRVRGLAELLAAAVDGIGIQARIDLETFDSRRAYEVLELLLRNSWREFAPDGGRSSA